MDGLLLLDKPKGISSFDCIRRLRRLTVRQKIGHAGTLDPLASGLMLMLFGTATKQAASFSKLNKTYVAQITLGANSSTGDAEGMLEPVSNHQPTLPEVEAVLAKLTGEIDQVPPMYSAIKIDGKEAYKYARAGQVVSVPSRRVTVYWLRVLEYAYPRLQVETRVSSGTYIRTLAEDIGDALGTGAYLSDLVRTEVGDYKLAAAAKLDDLEPQTLSTNLLTIDKT